MVYTKKIYLSGKIDIFSKIHLPIKRNMYINLIYMRKHTTIAFLKKKYNFPLIINTRSRINFDKLQFLILNFLVKGKIRYNIQFT